MDFNSLHGSAQLDFSNENMHGDPSIYSQVQQAVTQDRWSNIIDPLLQVDCPDLYQSWQNQSHQPPLERYMDERQRTFFTTPAPAQLRESSLVFAGNLPSAPISTLPQSRTRTSLTAVSNRLVSPAPSTDPNSVSSAQSPPATDNDWFHDFSYHSPLQASEDHSWAARANPSTAFPEQWGSQHYQQANGNCVKLSQVQFYNDPQHDFFGVDESYSSQTGNHHSISMNDVKTEINTGAQSYPYPADEGLGTSIKDQGSPDNTNVYQETDDTSDLDADGEIEDTIIVETVKEDEDEEAESDTEYRPKSTRTRQRRAPNRLLIPSNPANKRYRVSKPVPKTKGTYSCKTCSHSPFKDVVSLQRHIAGAHTRSFLCVFDFAGCQATFSSKNEWKRHVATQHINLQSWVCELGACGKNHHRVSRDSDVLAPGSEFNRKDLFAQHLRRMHGPESIKKTNKKNLEWEEKIKVLQESCLRIKRQPPTRLACPLSGCDASFEGGNCWDARMEHVGKHLEEAGKAVGTKKSVMSQGDDILLVQWALGEKIIERGAGGAYKLCGLSGKLGIDEDAEGEEE